MCLEVLLTWQFFESISELFQNVSQNSCVKPSGPGLLFVGRLLITVSVSVPVTGLFIFSIFMGFPGGSDGQASACNVGDLGSIPRLGRSPGEGYGNPLQYSCLENFMDRGVW